jgi:xanthine dehydrogenase accessory factor
MKGGGSVEGLPVVGRIRGIVRGILYTDLEIREGQKVGDMDPREIEGYRHTFSDRADAVAGGVGKAAFGVLGGKLSLERA